MTSVHSPKFKTQKTAFYVLLAYFFVFQLSSFIFFIPGVLEFASSLVDAPDNQKGAVITSWWTFSMGLVTLAIIFGLVMKNRDFFNVYKEEKATTMQSIGWGIIGFFLVFFGQSFAALIEAAMGIEAGSENTAAFMEIARIAPVMIIVIALIGPILEEFVFRRVIFGSLIQVQGFWISAIISGIIFAAIHFDFTHILLYTVCGLIFAFLYHKTKRLLTSIIAHILLNTFVVVVQLNIDKLQQMVDTMPK
ncbi:MAG: type II CAAX endopeptidase family protein [Lysinibacillus sp.]